MIDYTRQPPMPSANVVIVPTIPEWRERSEDYIELSDAINSELNLSAVALDRGVPHAGSAVPDFVPLAFLITIGFKLADAALDALVDLVTRTIVARARTRWWSKGKQVEGRILGPDGEVLRRVTWESKEGEREWIDHD